jgi:PadR family transcriptional regulator PadR
MRVTVAVAIVLRAFLADPTEDRYGYDLMRQCGMGSGKLYPILDRLEKAGWLRRARERLDTAVAGRPPRVLYRLTAEGQRAARLELAALTEQLRIPAESRGRLRPELGGAR